jgi:hypothetical protein
MSVGAGAGDWLKVDAPLLEQLGGQLEASAGDLPLAPPPFVASGSDAISEAIAFRLPGIEGPIQEGLPQVKAEATKTASNIVTAAGRYEATDEQFAADYQKHQFDQAGAPGAGGSGGGGDSMSQMSQMMSMPMQMAQQAAQMPMQAMSATASVPQSVTQGVQQIGQITGGLGKTDGASDGQSDSPSMERPEERQAEDKTREDPQLHGAAPGESNGERAPDSTVSEAPPTQANPPAAQPNISGPRHAALDPSVNL